MEQQQFTDHDWEYMIDKAKSAARVKAGDNMPWHKAFGIELLALAERITHEKNERTAVSILSA